AKYRRCFRFQIFAARHFVAVHTTEPGARLQSFSGILSASSSFFITEPYSGQGSVSQKNCVRRTGILTHRLAWCTGTIKRPRPPPKPEMPAGGRETRRCCPHAVVASPA